jgi:hypothetical protein
VAITDSGKAVGNVVTGPGTTTHGVYWTADTHTLVELTPLVPGGETRAISVTQDGTIVGEASDAAHTRQVVMWRNNIPTILPNAPGITAACPCDPWTVVHDQILYSHGSGVTLPAPEGFSHVTLLGIAPGLITAVATEESGGAGIPYLFRLDAGWAPLRGPSSGTNMSGVIPVGINYLGTVIAHNDHAGYIWPDGDPSAGVPMPQPDSIGLALPLALNDSGSIATLLMLRRTGERVIGIYRPNEGYVALSDADGATVTSINNVGVVGGRTAEGFPGLWLPAGLIEFRRTR